ncbi:MAG: DUF421 domain-containing protein [Gemmatimonadaceae bacterium]|jgi:uncharacterized membrane protein YcaP (DUF421 family)|nr:DUF421 domain-containing protein [Gemmatimonadaceae bacterium]
MTPDAWFPGWAVLGRTLVVGIAAYATLVLVLRITGKRTLAKLNAFDLVVTVSLGSTLASVLTSKDVAWAQGALAFAMLAGLQYAVTWASVRSARVRRLVRSEPALLVHRGMLLHDAMRRERVIEAEVQAAVRAAGLLGIADADTVVLETDGTLSVVPSASTRERRDTQAHRGHHVPGTPHPSR